MLQTKLTASRGKNGHYANRQEYRSSGIWKPETAHVSEIIKYSSIVPSYADFCFLGEDILLRPGQEKKAIHVKRAAITGVVVFLNPITI